MTPETQRIAIAEAWGLTRESMGADYDKIPDYLNDLNAMHEAEKALRPPQQPEWDKWREYCDLLEDDPHATAERKAEALLRTLNLWQE